MGKKDDQFLKRLLAAFRVEADEHIRAINKGLLDLEMAPGGSDKTEIIEVMYREAHSLKGASRTVNMGDIESLCQAVESIFASFKAGRLSPSTEMFDTLHRATDAMGELLAEAEGVDTQLLIDELGQLEFCATPKAVPVKGKVAETPKRERPQPPTVATPKAEVPDQPVIEAEPVATAEPVDMADHAGFEIKKERVLQTDTVRIAVDKLDPLLRQVGEMVSVKLTTSQRVSDLMNLMATVNQWKQKWASVSSHGRAMSDVLSGKRSLAEVGKIDSQFTKLMDFLDWNQQCIKTLETKLKEVAKSAENDARLHGGMVDDLLEDMMNVLMLPCSSLLEMFPKLVRDLSRDSGKEVSLQIHGGDLEIDRRILDEMKDPLIHLVRNSIDHGVEDPAERERSGKPRQGTVTIAISQISGNQVELVVSDDGAGIDVAKVRDAARKRGVGPEQEKLKQDGQDAVSLIFRSEVSTSPIVSNISGRGLGLAIVRDKVENLGGNISVATAPQMGASFRIILPVTLSTFRGILVNASDQLFVIPTASVERVARIKKELIKTVGNRDTIEVNERAVPLVRLGDALELPRVSKKTDDSEFIPVMILRSGEALVAFSVEAILREQEVLVKQLGKQLSRVRNVAGATVLGSGNLAPILNVPDLIKSAMKGSYGGSGPTVRVEELENGAKSVLIVEDSITSRMLLKNILESSGYQVKTSVDGEDAWEMLKREHFDCVVSDIEMPKMDGFELTSNIRNDEKLSELPVVLVTSLGSREDRERGIDVGANAYIVKGSFDQNNLLETVERLV